MSPGGNWEVAFEKGFINSEQLYEALALQAKAEATNKPYKFLGQILIELGYLTEKQVLGRPQRDPRERAHSRDRALTVWPARRLRPRIHDRGLLVVG